MIADLRHHESSPRMTLLGRGGEGMQNQNASAFRDILLAGLLPTTAALGLVTVIAIERMLCDPSSISSATVTNQSIAWLACALLFAGLHILAISPIIGRRATLLERVQPFLILAAVLLSIGCLATYGVPSNWTAHWPFSVFVIGLHVIVTFLYWNPIAFLLLALFGLGVVAIAFGALLALAAAPNLFDIGKRPAVARLLGHHVIVAPIAVIFAFVGILIAELMFTAATSDDIMLFPGVFRAPVGSPSTPLYAAAVALMTWTIASTLTWGAGVQARNPTVTLIRSARFWAVIAIELVIALALAFYAADRVHSRRALFDAQPPPRIAPLVRIIRGGMAPLHEPVAASERLLRGAFVRKWRSNDKVFRAVIKMEQPVLRDASSLLDVEFGPRRQRRPLTCPEAVGPLLTCRFIAPIVASGGRLDSVILQRELPEGYDLRSTVIVEYSKQMPDAWLWRERSCWLHLDDWPARGDLVRLEVACVENWSDWAGRLRARLDQEFPRRYDGG